LLGFLLRVSFGSQFVKTLAILLQASDQIPQTKSFSERRREKNIQRKGEEGRGRERKGEEEKEREKRK
jgi:hypothetical protein